MGSDLFLSDLLPDHEPAGARDSSRRGVALAEALAGADVGLKSVPPAD
jgi:hypothetical protein